MTLQTDLETAIAQIQSDANKLNQIVNGDDQTEILTDGGTVASAAKTIKDLNDTINAAIPDLLAAVQSAQTARDEAVSSVGGVKITETDSDADILDTKLVAGQSLRQSVQNPSGDQKLEIAVDSRQSNPVNANANQTYTFDIADGIYHPVSVSSDCTFAFAFNVDVIDALFLEITNGGSQTITWPAMQWAGGAPPDLTASGKDLIIIFKDGDNILYGQLVGKEFS